MKALLSLMIICCLKWFVRSSDQDIISRECPDIQCMFGTLNNQNCSCDTEKSFALLSVVLLALIACGVLYMCIVNRKVIKTELSTNLPAHHKKKHPIRSYGSQDEADSFLCGDDDHLVAQQMPLMKEYSKTTHVVHSYCGSCGIELPPSNNTKHNKTTASSCLKCRVDFDSSYVLVS